MTPHQKRIPKKLSCKSKSLKNLVSSKNMPTMLKNSMSLQISLKSLQNFNRIKIRSRPGPGHLPGPGRVVSYLSPWSWHLKNGSPANTVQCLWSLSMNPSGPRGKSPKSGLGGGSFVVITFHNPVLQRPCQDISLKPFLGFQNFNRVKSRVSRDKKASKPFAKFHPPGVGS